LRQAQIKLRELNKEELLNREDIKELSRQAEAGRKQARNKRSQYESGSANYLNGIVNIGSTPQLQIRFTV
jgi:hypothetical protein